MCDNFDPDAWPGSSGSSGATGRPTARRTDDDDYDAIAFDDDDYADTSTFDDYGDNDTDTDTGRANDTVSLGGRGGYSDDIDDYDRRYAGDSYDDDDYDDDYDREPGESNGIGRKIIGALAALAVIGALAFGASAVLGGGGDDNQAQPAEQPALTNLPAGQDTVAAVPEAPAEVAAALDEALLAWGEFAVTGNLDDVRPYFVNDGPQFDRFEAEAREIQANPPGGDPLVMDMQEPQSVNVDENNWLMRGMVSVTRGSDPPQNFPWEMRMTRQSDGTPWQVLSVRQY